MHRPHRQLINATAAPRDRRGPSKTLIGLPRAIAARPLDELRTELALPALDTPSTPLAEVWFDRVQDYDDEYFAALYRRAARLRVARLGALVLTALALFALVATGNDPVAASSDARETPTGDFDVRPLSIDSPWPLPEPKTAGREDAIAAPEVITNVEPARRAPDDQPKVSPVKPPKRATSRKSPVTSAVSPWVLAEVPDPGNTHGETSPSLTITSVPLGATAKVNGLLAGTTPLTIDARPGTKIDVTLVLSGYHPRTVSAVPRSQHGILRVELIPQDRLIERR